MSGGGAAKPPGIHYEVRDEIGGRGVVHGYGMTEVPMIAQGSPSDSDEQLANTDGKPVEGAEVRIVTLDGRMAGPGEEGEVRVRGPMVFHGYTDPALTADAFDPDGFFRTGDLGVLRADGHVALTGRLKDVIVRKGENISAKEIEDLLYTHPKVIEVAWWDPRCHARGDGLCRGAAGRRGRGSGSGRSGGVLPPGRPDDPENSRAGRDPHGVAAGGNRQDPQEGPPRRVRRVSDTMAVGRERSVTGRAPVLSALLRPVPGAPTRIVFVCTGNICRSPMAEVAARTMAAATTLVDGTAWAIGC